MASPLKRILIVEDEPALVEVLQLLFTDEEGYELVAARSPAEAVLRLAEGTFHLVLADGFSSTPQGIVPATAALRGAAGSIPVVLFTAHRIPPAEVAAAGFAALIPKPFEVEALLDQVRTLLD